MARSMNDGEMTLGRMIYADVMHPVSPCTIDVAMPCTQHGLDLTVRVPLIE